MSSKALKKMKDTTSLNKIPIFSEHEHSWKNTMGFIESSEIDKGLWEITTDLESPEFNDSSALLINKLEHGTPISMSIGGRVLDYHVDKSSGEQVRVIDDLELFEVSFVGIPANKDASVISYIAKSFENLEEDAFCGVQIPKRLIPKEYIKKFGKLVNLWKYNLPGAWRLLYTLDGDKANVLSVILEWIDHKTYERRFRY